MTDNTSITQERLKTLVDYDPATGVFTWRSGRNTGKQAGSKAKGNNTAKIGVEGRLVSQTKAAWLFMTGEWIDQSVYMKNGNRNDLAWNNLTLERPSRVGQRSTARTCRKPKQRLNPKENWKRIMRNRFETDEEFEVLWQKHLKAQEELEAHRRKHWRAYKFMFTEEEIEQFKALKEYECEAVEGLVQPLECLTIVRN
ncbi:hypothetical protein [Roseibium sp.]|uniref:hypothetical protein n=1 Tax=Roseibium sp. TaxID=1936156 RepID=UPI003BAA01B8